MSDKKSLIVKKLAELEQELGFHIGVTVNGSYSFSLDIFDDDGRYICEYYDVDELKIGKQQILKEKAEQEKIDNEL